MSLDNYCAAATAGYGCDLGSYLFFAAAAFSSISFLLNSLSVMMDLYFKAKFVISNDALLGKNEDTITGRMIAGRHIIVAWRNYLSNLEVMEGVPFSWLKPPTALYNEVHIVNETRKLVKFMISIYFIESLN